MPGRLYLIPSPLNSEGSSKIIPDYVAPIVERLEVFLVEDEKNARRFLKGLIPTIAFSEHRFFSLNEHTRPEQLKEYLDLLSGNDIGIISEAGCPCVADPGSEFVLLAHRKGVEVMALVGPSSIVLALMGSGLNGQNFAFNGYLPKEKIERIRKIKQLEKRSLLENQTQIFMEAPYRNQHLWEDVLGSCSDQTLCCVAADLMTPSQMIKTLPIGQWKNVQISLDKRPAIFLIWAQS